MIQRPVKNGDQYISDCEPSEESYIQCYYTFSNSIDGECWGHAAFVVRLQTLGQKLMTVRDIL